MNESASFLEYLNWVTMEETDIFSSKTTYLVSHALSAFWGMSSIARSMSVRTAALPFTARSSVAKWLFSHQAFPGWRHPQSCYPAVAWSFWFAQMSQISQQSESPGIATCVQGGRSPRRRWDDLVGLNWGNRRIPARFFAGNFNVVDGFHGFCEEILYQCCLGSVILRGWRKYSMEQKMFCWNRNLKKYLPRQRIFQPGSGASNKSSPVHCSIQYISFSWHLRPPAKRSEVKSRYCRVTEQFSLEKIRLKGMGVSASQNEWLSGYIYLRCIFTISHIACIPSQSSLTTQAPILPWSWPGRAATWILLCLTSSRWKELEVDTWLSEEDFGVCKYNSIYIYTYLQF